MPGASGSRKKWIAGFVAGAEAMNRRVRHDASETSYHSGTPKEMSRRSVAPYVSDTSIASPTRRSRCSVVMTSARPPPRMEIVVREHGGDVTEPQPVERLERKLLQAVAEREPAAADRLGAVGENRPEALRRSDERAG